MIELLSLLVALAVFFLDVVLFLVEAFFILDLVVLFLLALFFVF